MQLARKLCLGLLTVSMLAYLSFAEAGTMTLADMIKYSDCIVIGKVVNASVNGKHIAELEVTQVLKGDLAWKRVRFYAAPIWACDISGAKEDETGLFFFSNDLFYDPKEKASLQKDNDGVPMFFITHSGRGRMIFEHIEGVDYVYAHKEGEVKFPNRLRYARYPKAEDRDLGLIKLADVLAYIKKRV
jgi:hypothetical protein